MKAASAATKAILATGVYYRANLYQFTLKDGTVLRYTDSDMPLVVSGNAYVTGLTIQRGGHLQKVGLETQTFDLTITPQLDAPTFVTVGGVSFIKAVQNGAFFASRLLFSKLFLSSWADTSPGAVPWFQGTFNNASPGRSTVQMQFNSDLDLLNVAMPRNVLQAGCLHTLFDAGCTLSKAAFTVAGTIAGGGNAVFTTNLTQATTYFDQGVIKFTSGVNNGLTRTVKQYLNTSGQVSVINPLPLPPTAGDTFNIYPGCDKKQATCSAKFSNLAHFRGYPYIPQPETLYAGGVGADSGAVDDPLIGSTPGGSEFPGSYQP